MSTVSPLAGDAASLIIRALLDFRSLWTTHDLVTTTGVPAQTIRRVVGRLEREELVERQAPGVIAVPSWLTLLRRWNEEVRFNRDVRLTYWRSKHGARPLLDRVATTPVRHAVSGAYAAKVWAPETPASSTVIYTPDARTAATVWELVPARGRAIILAEPSGDVVYTRSRKTDSGLRLAAPAQVLADLLTGAASSASAAEPLTHWMLQNELEWRY
ncbi:MarR family transcriptional regulator [Kribbella sp. NPDC055110]